jgi:hypothetical protein
MEYPYSARSQLFTLPDVGTILLTQNWRFIIHNNYPTINSGKSTKEITNYSTSIVEDSKCLTNYRIVSTESYMMRPEIIRKLSIHGKLNKHGMNLIIDKKADTKE